MGKKVVILYNRLSQNPNIDELDVLIQVDLVREELVDMGYQVKIMDIGDDLLNDINLLQVEKPTVVFNLVEATFNKGELSYIIPGLLKMKKIPYTGVPVEGLFITTHKILAKKQMKQSGIPTPLWFDLREISALVPGKRYLIKPISEDGSVGLNDKAVYYAEDPELPKAVKKYSPARYFLEEYIHGREFSLGMLNSPDGPVVLPPGEMVFNNYEADQPRILGYKAKWHQNTKEYKNTVRQFNTIEDPKLLSYLNKLCIDCWKIFELRGYARVDFRVDAEGNPLVIEVNGNPCISPDSGFIAASAMIGINRQEIIRRILNDVNF